MLILDQTRRPPYPIVVGVGLDFKDPAWNTDRCLALFSQLYTPAFRRLLRGKFASDELLSLIKDVFARKDVDDIILGLPKDDAQTFIDIVDEVRDPSVHHQGSTRLDQY